MSAMDPKERSEQQWRKHLEQAGSEACAFDVTRLGKTEPAHSGRWLEHKGVGRYLCIGRGQALFASDAKYDSGSAWPSYTQPVEPSALGTADGIEVHCARRGSHLGHVFRGEQTPTGVRHCINSASLDFNECESSRA